MSFKIKVPDYLKEKYTNEKIKWAETGFHHYIFFPKKGLSLDELWHHLCDIGVRDLFVDNDCIIGYDATCNDSWSEEFVSAINKIYIMDHIK